MLAAACGSSPRSPTSAADSQNPATAAFKYAACIREHGVSSFPDPQVSTSPGRTSITQHVPAAAGLSSRFAAAQKACKGIMPSPGNDGRTQADRQAKKRDLLAFAHCLRSHGVPDFPDPSAQGALNLQMISAAGVDLHAPSFMTAAKACVGVTHGDITLAQVAQAVNGPH